MRGCQGERLNYPKLKCCCLLVTVKFMKPPCGNRTPVSQVETRVWVPADTPSCLAIIYHARQALGCVRAQFLLVLPIPQISDVPYPPSCLAPYLLVLGSLLLRIVSLSRWSLSSLGLPVLLVLLLVFSMFSCILCSSGFPDDLSIVVIPFRALRSVLFPSPVLRFSSLGLPVLPVLPF